MFKTIILTPLLFFSSLTFGKIADSTQTIQENYKFRERFFISAGINSTQFISDTFFSYLYNKSGANEPIFFGTLYKVHGSTTPQNFSYHKLNVQPIVSIGIQLIPRKLKKISLHHLIEMSYMRSIFESSYSLFYSEFGSSGPEWKAYDIHEIVQSAYNQNVLSLSYKLQPAFKFIFLSLGINCSLNLVKVKEQKKEQIDRREGNADAQTEYSYPTENTISNSTYRSHFINVPLQLGVGGYIKIKKRVITPAFYYTPCFTKAYYFYTCSLGILF